MLLVYAVFRFVPFFQVLWAARNNFFFIIYFIFCAKVFDTDSIERIFENIIKLQFFNVACGIFEYAVLHTKNDYLGGMFGVEQGCNASLNVYLFIITAYTFAKFMKRKAHLSRLLWIILSSVFMAAISELKVFYVELILIILVVALLDRNKVKALGIIMGGFIFAFVGLQILSVVNSDSIKYLSSFDDMIEYSSRSDYGYGDIRISRFTAIAQVNEYFFKDDVVLKLFGYGFGACEDSTTFSLCNSDFADKYGYLQYRNLTTSMNYLETGIIGLVSFIGIFVIIYLFAAKSKKTLFNDEEIAIFAQVLSVLVIFNCIYNSAIRRPVAYLTYFALSVVFVYMHDYESRELEELEVGYDT